MRQQRHIVTTEHARSNCIRFLTSVWNGIALKDDLANVGSMVFSRDTEWVSACSRESVSWSVFLCYLSIGQHSWRRQTVSVGARKTPHECSWECQTSTAISLMGGSNSHHYSTVIEWGQQRRQVSTQTYTHRYVGLYMKTRNVTS